MTSYELLRMINAIRTPRGVLSDCVMVHGVSAWTFFQAGILNDLRRAESGNVTEYDGVQATVAGRRFFRFLRVGISAFSSFLFLVRTLFSRPGALILASDYVAKGDCRNPRLAGVYAWLNEHHVRYAEIIHTTYGDGFFRNMARRPAGVLYLDAVRMLARVVVRSCFRNRIRRYAMSADLTQFPPEHRRLVRTIVWRYYGRALESAMVTRMLTAIMRFVHPKVFLTIDDIRHYNELLVAARAAGTASVVFQHSNFNYFFGTDSLPAGKYPFGDHFIVWSRYWVSQLPEMSPLFRLHKDRLVNGGRADGSAAPARIRHVPPTAIPRRIFIPYEANLPRDIASRCMELLRGCPDVTILFSLRPGTDTREQLGKYGLTGQHPNVEVGSSFDLTHVDAAVGTYSTVLDDLVAGGMPVGVLRTAYRTFHDLSDAGLAGPLSLENICESLQGLVQLPTTERERRRGALVDGWGNIGLILSPLFGNI